MKSRDALRTISEVADDLELPQHVLRFWETRFSQIKPMKRGGGRRYYRPDDVDLLKGIRQLLYDEGYTIKGVQRLLKENGNRFVIAIGAGEDPTPYVVTEKTESAEQVADGMAASPGDQLTREAGQQAGAAAEVKSVGQIARDTAPRKEMSLLGRLISSQEKQVHEADKDAEAPLALTLGEEERKLLQNTLYELLECKRLLDQVR